MAALKSTVIKHLIKQFSMLLLLFYFHNIFADDFSETVYSFPQAWYLNSTIVTPPAENLDWQQVNLPDRWYQSHPDDDYPAWYRMDFVINKTSQAWGIYITAINTNGVIWLNGKRIGDGGQMQPPAARNWHRPLYFNVPEDTLQQGNNSLYIQFLPKQSRLGYLGRVYIGHDAILKPVYTKATLFKQTFIGTSTVLLLSFGVFISLLWFKRRQDSLYGWFSAACFAWSVFVFDMYVQNIPVAERIWDPLVFAAVGWLVIFMIIFFHRFWNKRFQRFERILLVFGCIGSLSLYLTGEGNFYVVSSLIWDNIVLALSLYMTWFILNQCIKHPSLEGWTLVMGTLIVVIFGIYDNLIQMSILDMDRTRLLPYGAPFMLGIIVWMLVNRFITALEETEILNRELDQRVYEKTVEVTEKYSQIKQIEEEKIIAQERERIMRDMHDGTGMHLVAALAQVDKGNINKTVLGETLQNALDHIRLMIDSLDPVDEDIVAVLAMFRSRMEARLKYSGINILWEITDVPGIPGLSPEIVLQLMHMLHEIISNIIKHSGADTITFRTGFYDSTEASKSIFIEVIDNGCGYSEQVNEGRGIPNLYFRANCINAQLQLFNHNKGAVVRILLPISYEAVDD